MTSKPSLATNSRSENGLQPAEIRSSRSYKTLTQQLDVLINQAASLFQGGRCAHRHATTVLDAISLSSSTTVNEAHIAASMTPFRYS